MILQTAEDEEERDELVAEINRPPSRSLASLMLGSRGSDDEVEQDDIVPEWADEFTPPWWGGHEAAEFDAERSGHLRPKR